MTSPPTPPTRVFFFPQVMTMSFHHLAKGFFPGAGQCCETGAGNGRDFNLNIPLKEGDFCRRLLLGLNGRVSVVRLGCGYGCGHHSLTRYSLTRYIRSFGMTSNEQPGLSSPLPPPLYRESNSPSCPGGGAFMFVWPSY